MGRYAIAADVRDRLRGVNLDVWLLGQLGGSTAELERLLEQRLTDAEAQVEDYCQRQFVPLARHLETIPSRGSDMLRLRHAPIYDVLEVVTSSGRAYSASELEINRTGGVIRLKPGTLTSGGVAAFGFPSRSAFPEQVSIRVQYRTAFTAVGDNVPLSQIGSEAWDEVARVTTDAEFAYFDTPYLFAPYKSGVALPTLPSIRMLKNGVDDSANWSAVSTQFLRAPIGTYSSAARYVLAYVPWAVSGAAAETAAALALMHKGVTDGRGGSGGVVSLTAQGFREDYGEFQYAGQIKAFFESARRMLQGYRRALIA